MNYGAWWETMPGAHVMNPGLLVMDGWMGVNINLLSLTLMMSFLTSRELHPEANLETE